jgi:hypothetical protein
MSDRDNITLPREVAEHLTKMLEEIPLDLSERDCAALTALRTALAAPRPEPVPVVWRYLLVVEKQIVGEKYACADWDICYEPFGCYGVDHGGVVTKTPLYTAPPAAAPPEDIDALRRDAEKWRSFAAAATELRRLYTEIERLKAANRELGDVVMDYKAGAQALSAENAILHAELEALRRDAERYRRLLNWLVKTGLLSRERCRIDSPASFGDWWVLRKPHGVGVLVLGYGQTEDAAIDAAMQEDKT